MLEQMLLQRNRDIVPTLQPTSEGSTTFYNKTAIQIYLPAGMTGEEPQNVDTVLFFMRLHRA